MELTLDRTPFAAQRAQQSELGVRGLAQLDVRRLRKAKPLGERLERRPHAHGFAIDAGQIFLGLGVAARLGEERGDLVGSRHERLVDRQPVAFLRELLDCSQAFAVLLRRAGLGLERDAKPLGKARRKLGHGFSSRERGGGPFEQQRQGARRFSRCSLARSLAFSAR